MKIKELIAKLQEIVDKSETAEFDKYDGFDIDEVEIEVPSFDTMYGDWIKADDVSINEIEDGNDSIDGQLVYYYKYTVQIY